jgi:Tol biopolymer transport system component
MRKPTLVSLVLVGLLPPVLLALSGCGGNGGRLTIKTVSERCGYSAAGQIVFAAWGGNVAAQLRYLYLIPEQGGSLTLLTPSHNTPKRTDEGGWHPSFSPDGSRIAMTARRPVAGERGSEDIYLIPTSGGETAGLTRLTDDPAADDEANWSPDGTLIVFMSTRQGNPGLYVMGADGSNQHAVLSDEFDNEWPCFNPQNPNLVAFQSNRGAENATDTDIFTLDTTTQTITQLTDSPARDGSPSWSPDGTRILFHSDRAGDFDIWSIQPDGGGVGQVTNDASSDGYPVWRPDGERLVFTRSRQVWTCRPDGTDLRQLTRSD